MSDASLVNFLQTELLVLSNEIKKKYPDIKESIENIFQLIRKIKDDSDRPNAVEVFSQTELILQPIVLSSRTGNSRVIAIALNCLQKLVIFKAFPRECIGSVFGILEIATEMNSDIQLKSLQCLSPLMANFNDLYGAELIRIFSIAFKLQESKVGMVNNATAAIIRQMIISLFAWVGEEESINISATPNSFEVSHAQDALLILSDVTCRLDDQKCEALDLSKVDKPFALDLIESVLVNNASVIKANQTFSLLVKDRICPYLIETLKLPCNSGDFAKICRHWRIIQLLFDDFNDMFPNECETFIAFGIKILREGQFNWEKAMILEVFKSIFQSQNLIEEIYLICEKNDNHPTIFKEMMQVMLDDVMVKVLNSQPSPLDTQGQILEALGKSSVLTQFDKSAPPSVSPISLLLLAYDSFNFWFGNLSNFLKTSCTENNSLGVNVYCSAKDVNLNAKSVSIITDLILFIGGPLCGVMERVYVELCYNQPQLHAFTLEFFSRGMIIFSVFEFRSQLRQLMNILLKYGSNLFVIQMILETSLGIGELLEDSLFTVVKVIQHVEFAHHQKLRQQQQTTQNAHLQAQDNELSKVIGLVNNFTDLSVIWKDQSFAFLIQSYSQLIDETIENISDERLASTLLLILSKLKRFSALNMSRFIESEKCTAAWELLMEIYVKTMQLNDVSLRQNSSEIVGIIVDLFIKSVPPARMKSSKSQVNDSSCENYQMRIILPLAKMSQNVPWIDVQKFLLEFVMNYLSVFGECLSEASWVLIWTILRSEVKLVDTAEEVELVGPLYQKVHDTVKVISGDFLASIPISCVAEFIDLIAEIGRINLPDEVNIPLNSVRYLWDISDFLYGSKVFQDDVFNLWTRLLKHLSRLSLDDRPELRNSAVQTLLRTINMNGCALKGYNEKWSCLFEEILFEFLKDLRVAAKNSKAKKNNLEGSEGSTATTIQLGFAHFTRDTETKQWDETESIVMTGISTLVMNHFKEILIELPEFPRYWAHILQVLRGYALLVDGSVELTGVAINCLFQLSVGLGEAKGSIKGSGELANVSGYCSALWLVWKSIGTECENGKEVVSMGKCLFFTQDTLLKYFKIFSNLLSLCEIDLKWLEASLTSLTVSLQLPTPSDQVRDIESPTEVQKHLVNQILNDLLSKISRDEKDKAVVLAKEIAKWMKLATNAPRSRVMFEGISMGYVSSRSRQSTTSSANDGSSTNDGLSTNSGSKANNNTSESPMMMIKPTFIAMTSLLLDRIAGVVTSLSVPTEGIIPLIDSLGRFMRLKYKCPMNSKMAPLWRTSTSVYITILIEVCGKEADASEGNDLWKSVVNSLRGALHSAKEMFNENLKIELIEADEKFDCQLIDLIVDVLIPYNARLSNVEFIEESVNLIFEVARITKFSDEKGASDDFLFPSGVKSLPVAVKEILSFSAYKSIFRLAKMTGSVKVRLIKLLTRHLEAFLTDRQIFGNDFPFPRLRDAELKVLMKGMRSIQATEELKQVYDLIVQCADFGGNGGCEGVRRIVEECRRVLLLFDESGRSTGCEFESETDEDEDEGEGEGDIETASTATTDLIKPKTPIQAILYSSARTPSTPNSTVTMSSRRSMSDELFDHLTHDLRIMQLSQNSRD